MSSKEVYNVRLEPVGIEIEVEEDETVLDAAFRQGIAVPHGCKEGQCASCKSILIDGEIDLKKYSTFALSDMERDQEHILLCRTLAFSDLEIELLNYDEETPRLLDPGQGLRGGGEWHRASYPRHPAA